ncbi:MAG TPA: HAMP domain-containing sensor histidine kinase [Chloroflexota bacterium]|nr:HAMP domain-containing sensor histidine kinase [Chloroflexota bacterium]
MASAGRKLPTQAGDQAPSNAASLAGLAQQLDEQRRINAALSDACEEFVRGLAHDLKNPLAAIKISVQGMQRSLDRGIAIEPEKLADRLGRMDQAVEQTLELIASARARMGAAGASRPPLQLEEVDLVALTRGLVEACRESTGARRVVLECESPQLIGRWGRARIRAALLALLDNALKFSPGGAPVRMKVRVSGDFAEVSMKDQGIGIPARDQKHLGERFYRAENVLGHFKGAGLGLFEAKLIAEEHQGNISISSEEGNGAIVTLRLPL